MKFSICIPTLNEEKYISGILNCLIKQTYKEFELVIVDGKSEDKTKDVVMGFKDKLNLKFLESPKRGVSFQRNYGAKNSNYEYIIFFDADVQIDDDFLERINLNLEKKDIDILTSWNRPLSTRIDDEFLYLFNNFFCLELIKKVSPGAVGVFICVKRKSFEKIGGFRENINYAEDYDLAKRFYKGGFKYALLKKPQIKVSVRRFEKEGRLNMTKKQIKAASYYLLGGKDFADKLKGKVKHEFGKF